MQHDHPQPSQPGTPTKEEFAGSLLLAIYAVRPDLDVHLDSQQFELNAEEEQRTLSLDGLYTDHCRLPPPDRPAHLRMLAAIFCDAGGDIAEDYAEARGHLRPRIWNRSIFEELDLRRRIEGSEPSCDIPLYPLGEHLYSSLVYDLPSAMRTVSMEDLAGWGVTVYQAIEDAVKNLESHPFSVARIGRGFYTSVAGDHYDSSRLLLIGHLQSLELGGDLIALVPRRDSLFVCGSDDIEALKVMLHLTGAVLDGEKRPLSPLPLILKDGEWHDWEPHAAHPLFHEFAEVRNAFLGSLYASQKPLLEQLLSKQDEEVFVATCSGLRRKDTHEMLTYCVWGEGVDSLLPRTDLVMLPTEHSLAAMGFWADVRRTAGALMQPVPGLYPRRFRVREFPSYAQLEEIGCVSL